MRTQHSLSVELIDTLWNVNMGTTVDKIGNVKELIDTLWNVNFIMPVTMFLPSEN